MERFCFVMSVNCPLLLILGGIVILINMLFVLLFNSTASIIVAVQNRVRYGGLIMLMNQGGRSFKRCCQLKSENSWAYAEK